VFQNGQMQIDGYLLLHHLTDVNEKTTMADCILCKTSNGDTAVLLASFMSWARFQRDKDEVEQWADRTWGVDGQRNVAWNQMMNTIIQSKLYDHVRFDLFILPQLSRKKCYTTAIFNEETDKREELVPSVHISKGGKAVHRSLTCTHDLDLTSNYMFLFSYILR